MTVPVSSGWITLTRPSGMILPCAVAMTPRAEGVGRDAVSSVLDPCPPCTDTPIDRYDQSVDPAEIAEPIGVAFAVDNAVLFALYIVLGRRVARSAQVR